MKTFLIHLLGGYTREEQLKSNAFHFDLGCRNTADIFKQFANQINGIPADDWCKLMYAHIVGYGNRSENNHKEESNNLQ